MNWIKRYQRKSNMAVRNFFKIGDGRPVEACIKKLRKCCIQNPCLDVVWTMFDVCAKRKVRIFVWYVYVPNEKMYVPNEICMCETKNVCTKRKKCMCETKISCKNQYFSFGTYIKHRPNNVQTSGPVCNTFLRIFLPVFITNLKLIPNCHANKVSKPSKICCVQTAY